MVVVKCVNCGGDIPAMLEVCPRCNAPIPRSEYRALGGPQPQYAGPSQYPVYYPPRKLSPPGKNMIFVSGILLTVSGGISLLSLLQSLMGTDVMAEFFMSAGITVPVLLINIWSFISAAVILAFGILGIKNSQNAEKAKNIVIMGIVLICLQIAGLIIILTTYAPLLNVDNFSSLYPQYAGTAITTDAFATAVAGVVTGTLIMGSVTGCVLPILYIVGGSRLKRNAGND